MTVTRPPSRPALAGPFASLPDPAGIQVTGAVEDLVGTQVRALLQSSPAYYAITPDQRGEMEANLTKIAAYSAALIQDGFGQAEVLGQQPVLRQQMIVEEAPTAPDPEVATLAPRPAPPPTAPPPLAVATAGNSAFEGRAVGQVARVTEDTLNAIDFPNFVADLIRGTFDAIVSASIQQMEAYGELLANVAKTVDQFMSDNITDNQARDYLASKYPGHVVVDTSGNAPQARLREGAEDLAAPDLRTDLGAEVDEMDDDNIEATLVPAARRQLAQSRHQVLSTMVLMGINRIVVTSGRVRAKLDFHIDASDTGQAENASQFDFAHESSAKGGFLGFSARTKTSVAYVRTSKQVASDEINVEADLSGELDLKFKSETFPLERFADMGVIGQIQQGTANPSANPASSGGAPVPE